MAAALRSGVLKGLLVAGLVGGLIAFFAFGGTEVLSLDTLSHHRAALLHWRSARPVLAVVLFIAVYAVAVAFSVPGGVWLTISGGFMFGAGLGAAAATAGATAGASAVFLAARYVAGDLFRQRAERPLRRMERGFRRNAVSYLLFLRLVPVFPFWLVNIVPSLLDVPFRTYLWTTAVGIIPGAFVYALVGDGLGAILDAGGEPDLGIIFAPEVLAPLIGLALLSLLPVLWRQDDGGDDAGEPGGRTR